MEITDKITNLLKGNRKSYIEVENSIILKQQKERNEKKNSENNENNYANSDGLTPMEVDSKAIAGCNSTVDAEGETLSPANASGSVGNSSKTTSNAENDKASSGFEDVRKRAEEKLEKRIEGKKLVIPFLLVIF